MPRYRRGRPTNNAIRRWRVEESLKRNPIGRHKPKPPSAARERAAFYSREELREDLYLNPRSTAPAPGWARMALETAGKVLGAIEGDARLTPPNIYHLDPEDIGYRTMGVYLPRSKNTPRGTIFMRSDLSARQYFRTLLHEIRHWMQDLSGTMENARGKGLSADDIRPILEEDADTWTNRILRQARAAYLLPEAFC